MPCWSNTPRSSMITGTGRDKMVDLSDVIGKAIGGMEGQATDNLIDVIRLYFVALGQKDYDDVDVVLLALDELVHKIGSKRGERLALPTTKDLVDDFKVISNLVHEYGGLYMR